MTSTSILLITGGNAGLGFETVKSLAQSSKAYTVLLGGRSLEKAEAAAKAVKTEFPKTVSTFVPVQIDIEDDDSISKLSDLISSDYGRLDVLLNNAGAQLDPLYLQGKMPLREMWNKSWNVNTTSTHILTFTLMPLLLKSSDPRLLFITSGTSTIGDHGNTKIKVNESPEAGWPKSAPAVTAYRASKTGLNMMMAEWSRILKNDGVKIWCVSPGYLATGLGVGQETNKKMGAIDPSIGANLVRSVIEGDRDRDVGKVVLKEGIQVW